MLSFVGIVVVLVCWYCVCVLFLCQLSPFWPRILFGFRFLQSGIALFGIFLSIKFNSIYVGWLLCWFTFPISPKVRTLAVGYILLSLAFSFH